MYWYLSYILWTYLTDLEQIYFNNPNFMNKYMVLRQRGLEQNKKKFIYYDNEKAQC